MRIVHVTPSIEEDKGGPSKSVQAIARALAAQELKVELLATDPAGPSRASHGRLQVEVFRRDPPRFMCRSVGLSRHLEQTSADVIHHHALWLLTLDYARRSAQRQSAPLVISPRGAMGAWAWQHRAWKKNLARRFIHPGAFEAAAGWHATSAEEASDIRTLGFKQPICVAPNGVDQPTSDEISAARAHWQQFCPAVNERPVAIFYSRLHRKKRVRELIELWAARAPRDWLLLVVGIPQDYTAEELQAQADQLNAGERIRVFSGLNRPAPYAVASLFLLPSFTENFGLVIAEALTHGVPAIVTDTTPWLRLNDRGSWCVPWVQFGDALVKATALSRPELESRGAVARDWVLSEFSWHRSAGLLRDFYQQLLAKS